MTRLLLTPLFTLLLAAGAAIPAARAQADHCWFGALTDAQKRALVQDYARVQQTRGKPAADAWAQAQRAAYIRRFAANGTCPADTARAMPPRAPQGGRAGKREGSCKRMELENQNVPNPGGTMGWALVLVCKE